MLIRWLCRYHFRLIRKHIIYYRIWTAYYFVIYSICKNNIVSRSHCKFTSSKPQAKLSDRKHFLFLIKKVPWPFDCISVWKGIRVKIPSFCPSVFPGKCPGVCPGKCPGTPFPCGRGRPASKIWGVVVTAQLHPLQFLVPASAPASVPACAPASGTSQNKRAVQNIATAHAHWSDCLVQLR